MKDLRYDTVKKLIVSNQLIAFREILDIIPKTRLALDIRMKPDRLNRIIVKPELFVVEEIFRMADLIGVDAISVMTLVYNEIQLNKKGRKKKS